MTGSSSSFSGIAIIAALVALAGFLTAGVLLLTGDQAAEKLAVLSAFLTTIALALIAALRADAAAKSTDAGSAISSALNGSFDARVRNANRVTAAEPSTAPLEAVPPEFAHSATVDYPPVPPVSIVPPVDPPAPAP